MKFKKSILFLLAVTVVMIISACGNNSDNNGSGSNASGETFEMDINNWTSSSHHYSYNVLEPWKEMVEEKTDGRVKVNIHEGSSLGESTSVYQDVKGGLYDVGLIVANYFYDTKFFPYTIGNLPFALEGPDAGSEVLEEFVEKYGKEDLAEEVIMMPASATDGYDLFSTKPIKQASDLKGLKMRVNGKSENAFVESLGGVPVSIPTEETYEGLDKGMIDTAFYTPIGAVPLKFDEPAPYITKLAVASTPIVPIMNKDFYETLPDDLQKLFDEELNPKLTELFAESYKTLLDEAHEDLAEAVKDRGEFIELDDEAYSDFQEISEDSWDAWKKDADEKGYDGDAMVEDFLDMLEEHGYDKPF